MTAFARREDTSVGGTLSCELRSVNHRYREVSIRLPDELRSLEPTLRERTAAHIKRGKVECQLRLHAGPDTTALSLDHGLLRQLVEISEEVRHLLPQGAPVNPLEVLRWPGVVKGAAVDHEALQAEALALVEKALADLVQGREREGLQIRRFIDQRLVDVGCQVAALRERQPELVRQYRQRLQQRLAEAQAELEPGRLEQEVVVYAQRADVAEELDRLDAHLQEIRQVLEREEPVGRRLDFLMQELNREANTLGSKATDTHSSQAAVELKVLVEQIREQVQNIE